MNKREEKQMQDIERVAIAAVNLLAQAGLMDAGMVQMLCMAGRHEMVAEMMDKKRATLADGDTSVFDKRYHVQIVVGA